MEQGELSAVENLGDRLKDPFSPKLGACAPLLRNLGPLMWTNIASLSMDGFKGLLEGDMEQGTRGLRIARVLGDSRKEPFPGEVRANTPSLRNLGDLWWELAWTIAPLSLDEF